MRRKLFESHENSSYFLFGNNYPQILTYYKTTLWREGTKFETKLV